ncbi:hypothetical protein [Neptunicella sp. SCSIO 80796]|uniref:glycosyltransferase family protein n=1 Tax=Neptunicella plasticusilytica TaxID=3117012 RepID=UPI003A4DDEC1
MTSFCIASPHKNELWYDYRLYVNLKAELVRMGFQYRAASKNRIYLLGGPERYFYHEVGRFDPDANNLALIYCHSEKLKAINHFTRIFVCSDGVRQFLNRKKLYRLEFLQKNGKFSTDQPLDIIRPFSSLEPTLVTRPRYQCDISFVGTPRIRPILEAVLPYVEKHGWKLNLYGPNWDSYGGNPLAQKYWTATNVPYEDIPLLARGCKICLIDHHATMNRIGSVSHKYIDFIKAGGFVISDWNKDAKQFYKGVCFRTPEHLVKQIELYLDAPELREKQKIYQQDIVAQQSTGAVARQLANYFIE